MCEATRCAVCRDGGTRTHARPVPHCPREPAGTAGPRHRRERGQGEALAMLGARPFTSRSEKVSKSRRMARF